MASLKRDQRQRFYMRVYYMNNGNLNCYLCDKTTQPHLSINHPDRTTIDHVIPKSKGGGNRLDNLRVCCYACNEKKGDKLYASKTCA